MREHNDFFQIKQAPFNLNLARLIFIFSLTLYAGNASPQLDIRVTPTAVGLTTLADLKKNPNTPVTLIHALAILKDPALRDDKGTRQEIINIHLDAGIYRLNETLHLDAATSGNAEHPVTIAGPKQGSAIITGGRSVNGFSPITNRDKLAHLPEAARSHVLQTDLAKQGITDFGQHKRRGFGTTGITAALEVFYRNQPMTLARWPNQGFAKIATTPDGEKGLTFTVSGTNLKAWKNEINLLATGYWSNYWADTTIAIETIDLATQQFTLTAPAPPYGLKIGLSVFFQNALAELDQPGEWYLDKVNSMLYFWPPETLNEKEVEVSMLEKLLVIDNASHIRLNGLTFQSARGDAITIQGGQHVSITNSIIRNIGNRAAVISGQDNGLVGMLIENTGEGGVVLAGGDRQTLTPANLYVERSTIRRFARLTKTYQPAVLMSGVGNRVIGNQISDTPHTAILFTGNDHLITLNEIYGVCKEAGDSGAIYTGRDWTARGTVISYNYLHDIPPNVEMGRTKGVYLDDQASGITIRGNLFEKVDEAVFIGGGRDNLIEDNTFLKGNYPIHLDARGKKWMHAVLEKEKDTLQKRIEAVPYNQTFYKQRYQHLANLLEDEPGMPKYNVARRNLIIGNSPLAISKDAAGGISVEGLKIMRQPEQ
jgi:hypothetical protein